MPLNSSVRCQVITHVLKQLEAIPDDETWHVSLGENEFLLSNFEMVDLTIYPSGDVIIADVVKKLKGPINITSKNKIEFEVQDILFIKSACGSVVLYQSGKN